MANLDSQAKIGFKCSISKLYNHSRYTSPSSAQWSELQDPVLEERRLKALGEDHAIVHRFSKQTTRDGRNTWVTYSIEIKSPLLRLAMANIFHQYPDWAPDDNPFTFFAPYKPLLHRSDKIAQACKDEKDKRCQMEMHMLRQELEPLLSTHISARNEARSSGVISFEMLWLILAPGELFVSSIKGNTCVLKLLAAKLVVPDEDDEDEDDEVMIVVLDEAVEGEKGTKKRGDEKKPYWLLTLGQVDWNGSHCGLIKVCTKINKFDEPRLITRLGLYPLELAEEKEQAQIRQSLLARGKKFESFRGFHVAICKGRKFMEKRSIFGDKQEIVEPMFGRVIIDAHAFYRCQKAVPPSLIRTLKTDPTLKTSPEPSDRSSDDHESQNSDDDARHEDLKPLTDDELILTVPLVRGFDLKAKQWCQFSLDELHPPNWSDTPYDNLVLPEDEKKLLMAFADRNRIRNTGFDDFVEHKGEGVNILLCGPPGVGKTLTAEAIAEKSRVPLYMLSAGELGTTVDKLEAGLKTALTCCQLWNAMLLLDEADVFLEARSSNSLERNELVSIFLRQLEYYQGLMFLTTNRIDAIDPAFKSRIDLILPYFNLDWDARRKVWTNFVGRLRHEDVDLHDKDLDELAKSEMNGREIKNLMKTSLILASTEKPLKMNHLNTVLGIRKRVTDFKLNYENLADEEASINAVNGSAKRKRLC